MSAMEEHPVLGWIRAVPEPFWVRRWFRWKPACYPCELTFKTRDDHDRHWVTTHGGDDGD